MNYSMKRSNGKQHSCTKTKSSRAKQCQNGIVEKPHNRLNYLQMLLCKHDTLRTVSHPLCSQGHMKHHGVVSKTRPPARSARSSAERLPSATSMTSLNIPATRSSVGFWNQYQAFFNAPSNKSNDDAASENENESTVSAKSPLRSQMEPKASSEAREECSEGS